MRIMQIVTQMASGGAQSVAFLLHQSFTKRGHESELLFLYMRTPTYRSEPGVASLCDGKPNRLDYARIVGRLYARIRARQPDAVVAHTHYSNVLALSVAQIAGVPIRVAVQHSPVQRYPGISQPADWLCGSWGTYTKQVAVSETVVKSMRNYPSCYRRTVERIYNGIAFDESAGKLARKIVTFQTSGPKILHVGRFSAVKNQGALLEVLEKLPEANLILVGDGECRTAIELRVQGMRLQDRVKFLGEIDPKDVRSVMRSCDLFMFPSIYEAMPMALLEAMATGMPIVASDIPANRELLQNTGLLCELDSEQYAIAASRLIADPAYASELGKRAAERASQFTVEAMADNYEKMLVSS